MLDESRKKTLTNRSDGVSGNAKARDTDDSQHRCQDTQVYHGLPDASQFLLR